MGNLSNPIRGTGGNYLMPSPTRAIRIISRGALAAMMALAICVAPALARFARAEAPKAQPEPSVINFIGRETDRELTRVILHADAPIDYRGGMLRGALVVLDLANTQVSLSSQVVELGAPEVERVVIGPQIVRDGEKVLKVRLLGVNARSYKVVLKGNELHVELTAVKGSRDNHKGLPKLIRNNTEVMACLAAP